MIRYTYMMIDLGSIIIPLLFSFHPKVKLYKHWNCLIPTIVIVAIFYAVWDSWFVHLGVWGFNPAYLTGLYVGNLPLEELLFFFCIPYACLFTFYCIVNNTHFDALSKITPYINNLLLIVLTVFALLFREKPYTFSAFFLLAVLISIATLTKPYWFAKFYPVYGLLLVPFLIVNGLLTGTGLANPVVWYNPAGIIGPRILTIPIEDFFYGMSLILLNVWIYLWLRSREQKKNTYSNK